MVNIQDNPLYYAAAGGLIIGIGTSINYVLRGSVTGMSGMLYSTVSLDKIEMPKNISIIGGMLLISGIFFDIFQYGTFNNFTPFGPQKDITIYTSQLGFALAGILVGLGTKFSNGCTSGHGLCGLARFSIRSIVAVLTFLITGFVISTIILHAGGLGPFTQARHSPSVNYDHQITANICIALGVILPLIGLYMRVKQANKTSQEGNQSSIEPLNQNSYFYKDQLILFFVGLVFGLGLLISGMVRRSNIINFLALGKDWNPSLMFVLGCGLAVNLVTFTYMLRVRKQPFFGQKLFNPLNNVIDIRLVGGAILFGLGWGIGGLCPGPSIMQTSIFTIDVHLIWFPFFFMGQFIANKINEIYPPESQNAAKGSQITKMNANQQVQNSEIIEKGNPQKTHDQNFNKNSALNHNDVKIGNILNETGPGYTHANKLPSLHPNSNHPMVSNQLHQHSSQMSPTSNRNVVIEHIH